MAGKIQRCYACTPFGREFERDTPECDKCGATKPAVVTLTLVHWLVIQKDGPLQGSRLRFRIACQPSRPSLAHNFPGSPQPDHVSCPLCKKATGFAEAPAVFCEENDMPFPASQPSAVSASVPAVVVSTSAPSTPSTPTDTK